MSNKNIYWFLLLLVTGSLLGYVAYTYSLNHENNQETAKITDIPGGYKLIFEQTESHDHEGPINESISGSAIIKSGGETFTIKLSLNGMKPNTRYNSHLHKGDCDRGGAGGTQLEPVKSDTQGRGLSESIVRYDDLNPSMDHIIMIHNPTGHHVLCGEIPAIRNIKNSSN